MKLAVVVCAALLAACGGPQRPETAAPEKQADVAQGPDVPRFGATFWATWGDGNAELASYDLVITRYRDPRNGTAVTIFVSEPFSNRARVKADPGAHPPEDEFPVMKLNLVKDYQTGIYDYNDMLSTFVALKAVNSRPAGLPAKASFSSQEWCGHVYSQLLFDGNAIRLTSHSYFDGEADQEKRLEYPAEGVSEDVLYHWARGMAWPVLQQGQSRTVPILMGLPASRETHKPTAWSQVKLSRLGDAKTVQVPAGSFEVETLSADINSGAKTYTFLVEKAAPNRIVQWEISTGERGQLVASDRTKYWQLNNPGGEEALRKLRLSKRPPRTM